MSALKHVFTRPLASGVSVARLAQVVCYVAATAVFVLVIFKLTMLPLDEKELFFGLLLALAVFSSMICGGTLVRIEAELRRRNESHDN